MRRAVKKVCGCLLIGTMGGGMILVPQSGDNLVYAGNSKVSTKSVETSDEVKADSSVQTNKNGTTEIITNVAGEGDTVQCVYFPVNNITNKTTISLTQGTNEDGSFNGTYETGELFFGDASVNMAFYFLVDGEKVVDTAFDTVEVSGETYSNYTRDAYDGRLITIPGIFPGKKWDPLSNQMTYLGDGLYSYTFKDVPMSTYEFTIAAGTMDETYGSGGELLGNSHYYLTVPKLQDITIYYTDLGTHAMTTSLSYSLENKVLSGNGMTVALEDKGLTGVFRKTLTLGRGTYSDFTLTYQDKTYQVEPFTLEEKKDVTFYYDPIDDIFYNTASDTKIAEDSVVFDSKDTTYKSVFGAIEQNKKETFSIDTGKEVTAAELVVRKKDNTVQKFDLEAKETTDGQTWSSQVSFADYGEYSYFFVVHAGDTTKIYSDDDGYFGTGTLSDLGNLKPYEFVVYKQGYKTPDWMKNAVVYQIFPDRFNNGDSSNDQAVTNCRGAVDYESVDDWYTLPENPVQEKLNPDTYPSNALFGDGNYSNEIFGGDLEGITDRMDYLKALGVNVIYLNPVLSSISNHRYDTSDYTSIDPILGDMGDFSELVKAAEKNGMHIVMDGVFNHVSDDSIYFDRYYKHVAENGKIGAYPYWAYVYDYMNEKEDITLEEAKEAAMNYFKERGVTDFSYTEWFEIKNSSMIDENGNVAMDMIGERPGKDVYEYDAWWGYTNMPVVYSTNGSEYQTGDWADEVIDGEDSVTKYWLEEGSSGWRLDCANEVSDETWQKFRESVKAVNSDNVIIGEIWTDASRYLLGDMYDSVMNYVFRLNMLSYASGADATESIKELEKIREKYPQESYYALMNLVGSHDTPRVLSFLDGLDDAHCGKDIATSFPSYETTSTEAKRRQYLVAFLQMTYPGAPTIYYGDEIGMVGSNDPDCRRGMNWGKGNKNIVEWYAKLANIRNKYSALRTGSITPFTITNTDGTVNESLMAYARKDSKNEMIVIGNNSAKSEKITIDVSSYINMNGSKLTDVVSGKTYKVKNHKVTITVPAFKGVVLSEKTNKVTVNYNALKPAYDKSYIVK